MSMIVQATDLRKQMAGMISELPVATYLVELGVREEPVHVVIAARGADEAYALAVIKIRRLYELPGHERIRRISERPLELGEMMCVVMRGGGQ